MNSKVKDKDNLFNGLQNYPIDLFWDEDGKDTGIIPYAKGHISDYITEKINLIHIPNPYSQ